MCGYSQVRFLVMYDANSSLRIIRPPIGAVSTFGFSSKIEPIGWLGAAWGSSTNPGAAVGTCPPKIGTRIAPDFIAVLA